ncbi:MAG TPA: hypothetical protein VF549_10000 [Solirubrobacteraceae bacterium]|jgi:hypothetical protein
MAKRASEWIPHNILDAARRAGLKTPQLYLGRNNGHERHIPKTTLRKLAEDLRAEDAQEREREAPTSRSVDGSRN